MIIIVLSLGCWRLKDERTASLTGGA